MVATATKSAPKARQIAKDVARAHNEPANPIASLESKATTQSLRAVSGDALKTGTATNFSGQYLYDRFIVGDKEELTKLDIVRQMVKVLDVQSFKTSIGDMVKIARGIADSAIARAKESGEYDEANPPAEVIAANAKLKTAQNHQTVMRIAYGALKFASDLLEAAGYTDKTGYQMMRVIGLSALNRKGINWDGSKAEAKEDRQARKQAQQQGKILAQVMQEHPMQPKEARADYFARMDKLVAKRQLELENEARQDQIDKMVKEFRARAGDLLPAVLDHLLQGDELEAKVVH